MFEFKPPYKETNKMESKMNIQDIKYIAEENGSFFFTRKTMKFFGDTMKSFGVINPKGSTKAIVYRKKGRFAAWWFNPENGRFNTLKENEIQEYFG